ncbi:MAG TPA: hypothetical protein VH477_19390 [Bryobacteraceae bacterium]|jgi:hypothetical protein
MFAQLNHWIFIAVTAVDAILLLRVLQLKLHRTYLFITLACALTVFFDGVALWLGPESNENLQVFLYSRFLYVFILPAAAYDVWEEVKTQIAQIRKLAALRLVASLTLASIFGLIIAAVAGREEGGDALFDTFAIILWAAASTASLAFLWSMHRVLAAQKITTSGNTAVWLVYFQLLLAAEVLTCFLLIAGRAFSTVVIDSLEFSLNLYQISITIWCTWKLRGIASGVPSTPENANF